MHNYDRERLSQSRKEFGLLLQVEDGGIHIKEENQIISTTFEFRTEGMIVFSKKNDYADTIPYNLIEDVRLQSGFQFNEKDDESLIALTLKRDGKSEIVMIELDYPDFIVASMKKIVEGNRKKSTVESSELSKLMRELNSLYQEGILTESEFLERKDVVLKKMTGD